MATLLLLQNRGRVTAAEVAEELEVSLKTARRNLEALSMAGIPVYSQPGKGGGWGARRGRPHRPQRADGRRGAHPVPGRRPFSGRHVLIGSNSPEVLAAQLTGWGKQIEVLGPDEIRRHLARIGAELVAANNQSTTAR